MASGREIKAGRAFVELGVNDKLAAGLARAAARFKAFGATVRQMGTALAGVGVAGLAGLGATAKMFATMGSEIFDASKRMGITTEALSALKFAAEQSGAGLGELESGFRKMSRTIFDAREQAGEARDTLAALKITLQDLEGLSPDEQFKLIAARLTDVADETDRAALAQKIFGKGGTALLPMIKNLEATLKRAEELGIVLSTEDAKAADVFGDSLNELWEQARTVLKQVGAAVAQVVQPYMEGATRVMRLVIDWIKANRSLVVTIGAVATGLVAAGTAFIVLGLSISGLGVVLGVVAKGIGIVGVVLGSLLSPMGAVIAGLGVLAAWFVTSTKTGGDALAWLGDRFNDLKTTALGTFGAIADALAAGEIQLAAEILWTGMKVAFLSGTQAIMAAWENFKAGFVQVAGAAFFGALEVWETVKAALLTAWEDTVTFFADIWDGFIGFFMDTWNRAVNIITKGLNLIKGLWDDTFDTEAANAAANAALQTQLGSRAQLEIEKHTARGKEQGTNVGNIDAARTKAVDDINKREMGLSGAATENANAEIQKTADELNALREKLGMLRMAAGSAAALADSGTVPGGPAAPEFEDTASAIRAGVEKGLASIGDLPGIFNARALQSLMGGGTASERTADASEETARNTRKLLNKKLAFA